MKKMKIRHGVIADTYVVPSCMVTFYYENKPTASISLSSNELHANIQETGDHILIKKAGTLNACNLNWLMFGFGPEDSLGRLVVDLTNIDVSDLRINIRGLFEQSGVPFGQIPHLIS